MSVSIGNKAGSIQKKAEELRNLPLREGAHLTPLGWGEAYDHLASASRYADDARARAETDRRGARRALRAAIRAIAEARLGLVPAP